MKNKFLFVLRVILLINLVVLLIFLNTKSFGNCDKCELMNEGKQIEFEEFMYLFEDECIILFKSTYPQGYIKNLSNFSLP